MNARKLATQLRAAGWTGHARNLPLFLTGPGGLVGRHSCTREWRGIPLVFIAADSGYEARLADSRLVATEASIHLHYEDARKQLAPPSTRRVHMLLPVPLHQRASEYAQARGRSLTWLVKVAVDYYLSQRGY